MHVARAFDNHLFKTSRMTKGTAPAGDKSKGIGHTVRAFSIGLFISLIQWKKTALSIADASRQGQATLRAYLQVLSFIHATQWQGACHASSAVLVVLLGSQGIPAQPCIGEAKCGAKVFDHSWVEIAGEIYDPAVSLS
jgi:hypothetical protein